MHDDNRDRVPRRVTRRAALQLGAGAGVAAVAAPYLVRHSGRRAAPSISATPDPLFAPMLDLAGAADRHARAMGCERGLAQARSDLRHEHLEVRRASHGHAERHHRLRRAVPQHPRQRDLGRVHRHRVQLAHRPDSAASTRVVGPSDYPAGSPHTGERSGANVRGAHAIYHNSNTIGVALMGTYDDNDPPPAMIDALVTLLAWKCARWGIDPLGRGAYHASNGVLENLFNICGHRDTSATDCPGQRTEPMLPTIRAKVAARLTGAGYWIATELGRGARLRRRGADEHVRASGLTSRIAGIAGHPSGAGLLAVRRRRQRLRVRRVRLPRGDARRLPRRADRRDGADAERATATGWSAATAGSSASATRGSSVRPARCGSTRRCSA